MISNKSYIKCTQPMMLFQKTSNKGLGFLKNLQNFTNLIEVISPMI